MQDLQVIDILPQMITLSEAYIQASPLTYPDAANQKTKYTYFSNLFHIYFNCNAYKYLRTFSLLHIMYNEPNVHLKQFN